MPFSISDFRSSISSGVLRASRFEVEINFPTYAGAPDTIRDAALQAKSATVPSLVVDKVDIAFQGRLLPIPGDRTFQPFTCTFTGVEDFRVRDAFERWNNALNGLSSNQSGIDLGDAYANVSFYLLSMKDGQRIKEYRLECYPSEIGEIELDSEGQNQAIQFPVTFEIIDMDIPNIST